MKTKRASAMLMAALAASLLAAAAGMMVIDARSARAASSETLRLSRAEHRAQALLERAIVRLDSQDPMPAQGVLFADADGARVIRQDASGLIDVNTATPETLARLIGGLGFNPDVAITLADRIADWRDEDTLKRLHGAEAREYERASRPAPANRPFAIEAEVVSVLGVTPDLAACLAPYLTTYSGLDGVELRRASPELIRMFEAPAEAPAPTEAPPGSVTILTAEAPISEHAVLRRTIWLRLTRDPARPFMIHRAAQELAPAQASILPCPAVRL